MVIGWTFTDSAIPYATDVISKAFKRHPDLREKAERNPDLLLKDIRIRTFPENQLGHEDFEATLRHYIDNVPPPCFSATLKKRPARY